MMKKDKHPEYQEFLFIDSSTNRKFICGAAMTSKETQEFEGKTYPVCWVSTSSASHPFFTGDRRLVDAEGRVSKFQRRYVEAVEKRQKA
jgi:large subunit ribosomal protein L31